MNKIEIIWQVHFFIAMKCHILLGFLDQTSKEEMASPGAP